MFLQLIAMANQPAPAMRAETVILLQRILHLTACAPAAGVSIGYGRKIMELAGRMRLRPFAAYSPDILAREMHVCTGHFRRLFRRHAGRSFYDYLLHCRMLQEAAWLVTEGLAVKEMPIGRAVPIRRSFSICLKADWHIAEAIPPGCVNGGGGMRRPAR